jgi:hypothetical protein
LLAGVDEDEARALEDVLLEVLDFLVEDGQVEGPGIECAFEA